MTKHDARRRDHIIDTIERFQHDYGHSPSVRDIKEAVGLASTSAVWYHLMALERDGIITRCGCGCQRPVLEEYPTRVSASVDDFARTNPDNGGVEATTTEVQR